MSKQLTPNRLIKEKSPYLLQHAYNPIAWYTWCPEAFEKAKQEDKPVFVSIGYSCCHWCHVMERESFEDQDVADILNGSYISIKVDREERPDIDHLYMNVCQSLTGSGGWPLTVFLTPDKNPFFAGTYYPKESNYGRPGLIDLLNRIQEAWSTDRDRLEKAGQEIIKTLTPRLESSNPSDPHPRLLQQGYNYLKSRFDPIYGGFGDAPKFPTPHQLFFLLRYGNMQQGEANALEMVNKTLISMYAGGIYDHIGFGFARYSTDKKWLVPHFEKMLYDNALLALAYLENFQATKSTFYARVAREIFTYVLRDMTSPQGGFYTAEDADSEGEEGKFYVWSRQEIIEILGNEEGEFYCRLYDITTAGNFEGHNIPNLIKKPQEFANEILPDEPNPILLKRLETARQKLFAVREQRVHPYKDDKILTSWNGLMIAALARGAWVLNDKQFAQAAAQATHFLLSKLRDNNGRLQARYREGEVNYPAYLDDYAFLTWGLLELYQATFQADYLKKALELTQDMQDLFWDKENGGFFFIGHDAEQLPARPKELYDGAIPSGNSVATLNLFRLASITGDSDMKKLASEQLRTFAKTVADYPAGYSYYLSALSFSLGPSMEIVLTSSEPEPNGFVHDEQSPDLQNNYGKFLNTLRSAFLPQATILTYPTGGEGKKIAALAPHLTDKTPLNNRPTVYLCQNYACQAPITDSNELSKQIQ
jgi:hypothetical protein